MHSPMTPIFGQPVSKLCSDAMDAVELIRRSCDDDARQNASRDTTWETLEIDLPGA